ILNLPHIVLAIEVLNADLSIDGLKISRDTISYMQEFTVGMRITNSGDVELNDLNPCFIISPENKKINKIFDFPDSTIPKLVPKESVIFFTTYRAESGSEGIYTIYGSVNFIVPELDKEESLKSIETVSLKIQKPPELDIYDVKFSKKNDGEFQDYIDLKINQNFYISAKVRNSINSDERIAKAEDVKVLVEGISIDNEFNERVDLFPGKSHNFILECKLNVEIPVLFILKASGKDANSGLTVESKNFIKNITTKNTPDLVIENVKFGKTDDPKKSKDSIVVFINEEFYIFVIVRNMAIDRENIYKNVNIDLEGSGIYKVINAEQQDIPVGGKRTFIFSCKISEKQGVEFTLIASGTNPDNKTIKSDKKKIPKGLIQILSEDKKNIGIFTYPNPASLPEEIKIMYILPEEEPNATINIYDVSGQLIWQRDVSGSPGINKEVWDGTTGKGNQLSAGVYICELAMKKESKYWRIAIRPGIKK
ncbi:T9SS type A sorting domain-containing protein, partial [Candidatus Poribacteria bacterium]|nr:T9SS type A sorting domain-containing protein [Candidatus Poribacteria bacterium]